MTGKEKEYDDDWSVAFALLSFYYRRQMETPNVSSSWKLRSVVWAVIGTGYDGEKLNDSCDVFAFGHHRVVYAFFVDGGHLEMVTADFFSCAFYYDPVPLTVNVTDVFVCCASPPCLYDNCHHLYRPCGACPNALLSPRYVLYLSVGHVPFGYPNYVHRSRVSPLSSSARWQQLLLHEPYALSSPARLSPS
jgi:hypothetical protein